MTFTIDQYRQKLREQLRQIKDQNRPLFIGATTGMSEMVDRIFVRGRDSYGKSIGKYSTKPIYVNPSDSPVGFGVRGKSGESRFKNGNKHKTRYFEDGYRGFRKEIGRESGFTNLRLTNDLQSDISNSIIPASSSRVSQNPTPKKVTVNEYVVDLRSANVKKTRGLEKKYKTLIFKHTKQERELIVDTVRFELFKLLNG